MRILALALGCLILATVVAKAKGATVLGVFAFGVIILALVIITKLWIGDCLSQAKGELNANKGSN